MRICKGTHQNDGGRVWGWRSIYPHGNSRTVTIPPETGLAAGTRVIVREGRSNGQALYIRITEESGGVADGGRPPAVAEGIINETWCHIGKIRDSESLLATIPTEADERFSTDTDVMMVGGENWLLLIPTAVWNAPHTRQMVLGTDPTRARTQGDERAAPTQTAILSD